MLRNFLFYERCVLYTTFSFSHEINKALSSSSYQSLLVSFTLDGNTVLQDLFLIRSLSSSSSFMCITSWGGRLAKSSRAPLPNSPAIYSICFGKTDSTVVWMSLIPFFEQRIYPGADDYEAIRSSFIGVLLSFNSLGTSCHLQE